MVTKTQPSVLRAQLAEWFGTKMIKWNGFSFYYIPEM